MKESKIGALVMEHARQLASRGYSIDDICSALRDLPFSAKEVRATARQAAAHPHAEGTSTQQDLQA